LEALEEELAPLRERYEALRADEESLDAILNDGAERARAIARRTIGRVRSAIGIDPRPKDRATLKLRKS